MTEIYKIRFNTDFPASSPYAWRVIKVKENVWTEIQAKHILINAAAETTSDILPDQRIKHHITVKPQLVSFEQLQEDGGYEKIVFS